MMPDTDDTREYACPICGTLCRFVRNREGSTYAVALRDDGDLVWRYKQVQLLLQSWLREVPAAECERRGLLGLRIQSRALAWGIGESTAAWEVREKELKLGIKLEAPYSWVADEGEA